MKINVKLLKILYKSTNSSGILDSYIDAVIDRARLNGELRYEKRIQRKVKIYTKESYKHFLRLNNRKMKHTFDDMVSVGYHRVDIDAYDIPKAQMWCEEHCRHRWTNGNYSFWFAYSEDAALFAMVWTK